MTSLYFIESLFLWCTLTDKPEDFCSEAKISIFFRYVAFLIKLSRYARIWQWIVSFFCGSFAEPSRVQNQRSNWISKQFTENARQFVDFTVPYVLLKGLEDLCFLRYLSVSNAKQCGEFCKNYETLENLIVLNRFDATKGIKIYQICEMCGKRHENYNYGGNYRLQFNECLLWFEVWPVIYYIMLIPCLHCSIHCGRNSYRNYFVYEGGFRWKINCALKWKVLNIQIHFLNIYRSGRCEPTRRCIRKRETSSRLRSPSDRRACIDGRSSMRHFSSAFSFPW